MVVVVVVVVVDVDVVVVVVNEVFVVVLAVVDEMINPEIKRPHPIIPILVKTNILIHMFCAPIF